MTTETISTRYVNPTWTIEEVLSDCNVSEGAVAIAANLRAFLVTYELREEFMVRINLDPAGIEVFRLFHEMREEQLQLNPMPDDDFKDMFMLNSVKALTQYFKHYVSPFDVERMQSWGVSVDQLIEERRKNVNIHLRDALTKLYT